MADICKEMTRLGKGLSNENRYYILQTLMGGSKTVTEIAEATKIAQPTVSQHLRILKESDLVSDERRGQEIHYTMNVAYITKLLKHLADDVEQGNTCGVKNTKK